MAGKIIAVVNQKGGSGKTTVSMQFGGTLALRGKRVQVIDGDEQNSAVEWASMAPEGKPFPAKVVNLAAAGRKIHQEIKKFYDDNDYIIVDCPPAAESPVSKSVLLVADLALVPFIPDGLNMAAAVRIRDTIEDAQVMNPNLKALLILNRVEPSTKLTMEVMDLIPEFNMARATTKLHKRTHFPETFLLGATVHVLKSKAKDAIEEIEDFTDEVINFLESVDSNKQMKLVEGGKG
jgi:chromosome partitioning protein